VQAYPPAHDERLQDVTLDLLNEAGVRFLLHAFASGVLSKGGKVEGAIFETKSGPVAIRAKVVVDCTGDADMAVQAGAPFEMGRADGLAQPMTLMFRMVEFNRMGFEEYVKKNPSQWRGVHGLWDLVREATRAGELELPREDILFFATPHEHEVSVNSTRVTRVLGTDVWDLTYAECASRRQMLQIAEFLRRYVPGFERSYAVQSGVNVGVRETRRIIGEYQLTADDVLSARKFEDAIARGSYPVDIHNPAGSGTVLKRQKRGGRLVRTARVDGSFNVADFDPIGLTGIQENCTTSGSYSASTCKPRWMSPRSPQFSKWKRWKVPKCFASVW